MPTVQKQQKRGRSMARLYDRFSGVAKWAGSLTVILACLSACWGLTHSLHESVLAADRLKVSQAQQEQARGDQVAQVRADVVGVKVEMVEMRGDLKKLVGDVGEIKGALSVLTGRQLEPRISQGNVRGQGTAAGDDDPLRSP